MINYYNTIKDGDNNMNNEYKIKGYIREEIKTKVIKYLNHLEIINIEDLMKIYKKYNLKISLNFFCNDSKLIIDLYSVEFYKKDERITLYNKYKSMICNEIEKNIDEKNNYINKLRSTSIKEEISNYNNLIKDIDNYIKVLYKKIDNDIEIFCDVDNILYNKRDNKIIINNKNKKNNIDTSLLLKEDILNNKYTNVLEIIDGNFVVNTVKENEKPSVDYYAHTNIDEVYGLEGKWGLVDNNNIIIKPKYIYPFIKCGNNLQVMLAHTIENNTIVTLKHGLIDTKGNVIIPIKYLYMESMDNLGKYFRVVDPITYKSGVLDNNNKIIVPFKYEYIQASPDLELCDTNDYSSVYPDYIYQVKVCNNDLYGIYDLKLRKEVISPKYKYIKIIGYNNFLIGTDYDSCNKIISLD